MGEHARVQSRIARLFELIEQKLITQITSLQKPADAEKCARWQTVKQMDTLKMFLFFVFFGWVGGLLLKDIYIKIKSLIFEPKYSSVLMFAQFNFQKACFFEIYNLQNPAETI